MVKSSVSKSSQASRNGGGVGYGVGRTGLIKALIVLVWTMSSPIDSLVEVTEAVTNPLFS